MGKDTAKEATKEMNGEGERRWARQVGKVMGREAAKVAARASATTAARAALKVQAKDMILEVTCAAA